MFEAIDARKGSGPAGSVQAGGAGGRTTLQALLAADQAWYNLRHMQVCVCGGGGARGGGECVCVCGGGGSNRKEGWWWVGAGGEGGSVGRVGGVECSRRIGSLARLGGWLAGWLSLQLAADQACYDLRHMRVREGGRGRGRGEGGGSVGRVSGGGVGV